MSTRWSRREVEWEYKGGVGTTGEWRRKAYVGKVGVGASYN